MGRIYDDDDLSAAITVGALIEVLRTMPADAPVIATWEGIAIAVEASKIELSEHNGRPEVCIDVDQ